MFTFQFLSDEIYSSIEKGYFTTLQFGKICVLVQGFFERTRGNIFHIFRAPVQTDLGEFKVLQPPLGKLNKIRRRDFLIRRTGASVTGGHSCGFIV